MSIRHTSMTSQRRGGRIETAPATEPVTAAEFRTHIRAGAEVADSEAESFIAVARAHIENMLNIAMVTQTWNFTIDHWPNSANGAWWDGVRDGHINMIHDGKGWLELPKYPLQSVSSVTTYDEDSNATAVVVADTFDVDASRDLGRIALKSGSTWPTSTKPTNGVKVVYVVGYGLAVDVPEPLKMAVKQFAAHLYSHRGDGCDIGAAYTASGAASLASAYAVARL